jgi:hypothetical protein
VCEVCVKCVWSVCEVCVKCVWSVCEVCVKCVWSVKCEECGELEAETKRHEQCHIQVSKTKEMTYEKMSENEIKMK